jgi:hypothetical protein
LAVAFVAGPGTIEPTIGFGVGPAIRDGSCNVLVPLGL